MFFPLKCFCQKLKLQHLKNIFENELNERIFCLQL